MKKIFIMIIIIQLLNIEEIIKMFQLKNLIFLQNIYFNYIVDFSYAMIKIKFLLLINIILKLIEFIIKIIIKKCLR